MNGIRVFRFLQINQRRQEVSAMCTAPASIAPTRPIRILAGILALAGLIVASAGAEARPGAKPGGGFLGASGAAPRKPSATQAPAAMASWRPAPK